MNYLEKGFLGKTEWWRYVVVLLVVMFPFIQNIIISIFYPEIMDKMYENIKNSPADNLNFAINLIPFAFLLLILLFFVKKLHHRNIMTVITARKRIDWQRVFFAFFVWATIGVSTLLVCFLITPSDYVWNLNPTAFLGLVFISFFILPLQTSFEELLFRGYLMQGFGVLFKNTLFPLLGTSIIFGLLHGFNPEVEKLGLIVMVYYIGTGLLLGIFTLMDDGLELSLGFHAANNIVIAIFITSSWSVFKTNALVLDTSEPSLIFSIFIPVFVLYPVVLFVFSKKYGWTNWKEKLMGVLTPPKQGSIDGES